MLFFLTTQPLWVSGTILVVLTTALAMLGPSVVRRFVKLERLTDNNEIAGFKFATIGVLYAVLLAFAIIVVWQRFSDADTAVAQEAGAAETVFRLSFGIDDKAGANLREATSNYLAAAIAQDWPAMDKGHLEETRASRRALDAIYAALLTVESQSANAPLVTEILRQLDAMTQARRVRLVDSEGAVPGVVWLVLFGGAIVTIGFTFFFGTQSLPAQTMMTGLLSLLIFSELLAIVMIDRPFSGAVRVQPHALMSVLADFRAAAGAAPVQESQH